MGSCWYAYFDKRRTWWCWGVTTTFQNGTTVPVSTVTVFSLISPLCPSPGPDFRSTRRSPSAPLARSDARAAVRAAARNFCQGHFPRFHVSRFGKCVTPHVSAVRTSTCRLLFATPAPRCWGTCAMTSSSSDAGPAPSDAADAQSAGNAVDATQPTPGFVDLILHCEQLGVDVTFNPSIQDALKAIDAAKINEALEGGALREAAHAGQARD